MLEVVSALVFAKSIEDGTTELPEKCCLPATTRDFPNQPRTRLRATVTPRHIGFGQRFIDKDNAGRIDQFLGITPLDAFLCDIRTILPMSNSPGDPSNTLVPRRMISPLSSWSLLPTLRRQQTETSSQDECTWPTNSLGKTTLFCAARKHDTASALWSRMLKIRWRL